MTSTPRASVGVVCGDHPEMQIQLEGVKTENETVKGKMMAAFDEDNWLWDVEAGKIEDLTKEIDRL